MRVLYGVVGDGMGHATRSRVVIEHLAARGHDVLAAASGRAVDYLRGAGLAVREIDGVAACYGDGAMRVGATVRRFVREAPGKLRRNIPRIAALRGFAPEVVVTDFESLAAGVGRLAGVPVVCVDNQHALSRLEVGHLCAPEDRFDLAAQRALIRAKVPGADRYLVTSFFDAPVAPRCRADTERVPAVVRDAIERAAAREAAPGDDAPVLVYQSFGTDLGMLDALRAVDAPFVVYGLDRDESRGNVTLRRFSDEGFVDDLLAARAVLSNGGHSLLAECVRLRVPSFVVPLRHQAEQALNARAVAYHRLGERHARVTADALREFLARLDEYRGALARRPAERNADALARVDGALAAHAGGPARRCGGRA